MSTVAKPLTNQGAIATTGDGMDITRGYAGAIMAPSDTVLALRGGGDLRIYEQLLADAQVGTVWQQRRLAVTSREWEVLPGGDSAIDEAAAESLRAQLEHVGWDRVTNMMLSGVFYGYAVAEVIYRREGAQIVMDAIKVRNRRRFRFTPQGELRLLTLSQPLEGIPAPAPYFWHFATGADHDDEPYGLGIAHWLYWPVLFKRNGVKFWLVFLEKFGMPTALGKFQEGEKQENINRLLQALEAIQTDSGVAVPAGMQVELLEAVRSGTADYQALHDTMDGTIAKVVLGQTASTQGTPGRLGNDELQADVRLDLVKADADLVCESFNRTVARWLTAWNFPAAAPPQVWRKIEEPENLNKRAERDEKVARMGYKPSLGYVRTHYGDEWEPAPAGALPGPGVAFAERSPRPPADALPAQLERLQREGDAVVEGWVERLRDLVDRAESFEQLRDSIERAYPDLDAEGFAGLLGDAMAAAHLAGRYDIMEGF